MSPIEEPEELKNGQIPDKDWDQTAMIFGYGAFVFGALAIVVSGEGKVASAGISAILGLLSAFIGYRKLVRSLTNSVLAKAIVILVGTAALLVSRFWAKLIVANLTLMDPARFPDAVLALSYLITVGVWIGLSYGIILIAVLFVLLTYFMDYKWQHLTHIGWGDRAKSLLPRIVPPIGQVMGLSFAVYVILPALTDAAGGLRGGGLPMNVIVETSFVDNVPQGGWRSTDFRSACREKARTEDIPIEQIQTCKVETIHCSNISRDAQIAYIGNGEVAVIEALSNTEWLDFVPAKINIMDCDSSNRYLVTIERRKGT